MAPEELDPPHRWRVPPEQEGLRLDRFLAEANPAWSRSQVARWIRDGHATRNGAPSKPGALLRAGDVVEVTPPPIAPAQLLPQAIPLAVLYEDEHVIAVNKPPGLVIHPAAGNPGGTLVNALLAHCRDLSGVGGVERPGIVHRLDKDTSGVMVVARTLEAHTALVAQLSARQVHRQYLAIVVGALVAGGTAAAAIDRHPRDRLRMAVREDGKEAITHYRLRERFRAHTALECRLETGRTHQIRVHLASLGHPLMGDPVYGAGFKTKAALFDCFKKAAIEGLGRQALHAYLLGIDHPTTHSHERSFP